MSSNTLVKRGFAFIASCVFGFGVFSGMGASVAEGTENSPNLTAARPSERQARSRPVSCANALDKAREQQRSAHLREAQEILLECAQSKCSRRLKASCLAVYLRARDDVPSLVPVVVDESGLPLVDVQVKLDGKPVASRLDGLAISVDPGVHDLAFEKDGVVFANRTVMAAQGQRNRPISATYQRSQGGSTGKGAVATGSTSSLRPGFASKPPVGKDPVVANAGKGQKEPAAGKTVAKPTPAVSSGIPARH